MEESNAQNSHFFLGWINPTGDFGQAFLF